MTTRMTEEDFQRRQPDAFHPPISTGLAVWEEARRAREQEDILRDRVADLEGMLLEYNVGSHADPCWCDPSGDGPHLPRCERIRAALAPKDGDK